MGNQQGRPSVTARHGSTRWTREDAGRLLEQWARSGESLAVFARQRGIVPQRLSWWRKRLGLAPGGGVALTAARAAPPAFIPVTVRPTEREPVAAVVDLGDGLRVELRTLDGVSAAWVAALVRALGGAS